MSEPLVPAIADLLADQRERWARGDRVAVEIYLRQHPALTNNSEGLLDLIYQEVYLREQCGETPQREEYLRRFPRLATPLGEQFDVHQAIQNGPSCEPAPSLPMVPGYELLQEVGRGGMGRVYKARQASSGANVAVKILRGEHFRQKALRKRFLAEARAASALQHPHIVQVLEVNDCSSGMYLVMELIDGPSLETVIRDGRVQPSQAVQWLIPVAEAIHHAHGLGIIHRDLKPANIMLDSGGRPHVLDFGMAKILRGAAAGPSSTQQGTILGTPSYMPPEQAGDSDVPAGPYNDVYSLGAILYALLTGRPPFDEGDFVGTLLKVRSAEPAPLVRSLRPEVPDILERICQQCLSKRPAERFQTARELAEVLSRCQGPQAPAYLASPTTGETYPLVHAITVIGRAAECDVVLKSPAVSRQHCQLVRTGGQVFVEDLGSSHGTRVNGTPVLTRVRLSHGDRLEIAAHRFDVVLRNTTTG
jgi:eukaryotic-like serine/threonine-protein kinase